MLFVRKNKTDSFCIDRVENVWVKSRNNKQQYYEANNKPLREYYLIWVLDLETTKYYRVVGLEYIKIIILFAAIY